jgi:squalene-hopene/tetraprenyl-beta-curcumene cyclase
MNPKRQKQSMIDRRGFLRLAAGALAAPAACRAAPRGASGAGGGAIVEALDAGALFLLNEQSDDGGWRSRDYSVFRDGAALTPFITKALAALPANDDRLAAAHKGALFVQSLMDAAGTPVAPLVYPVYSAALAAISLTLLRKSHRESAPAPRGLDPNRWLALLASHQLNERLRWRRDDLAFGGWGYSIEPPRRPGADEVAPPFDSDLSSTLFAVSALRIAGRPGDDPAIADARVFVERCQNVPGDGGFFFTPTNEIQNKAGIAPIDPGGRMRFHSYGSATADGLRALVACGHAPNAPRVSAALHWLERNFSTSTNPGQFTPEREPDRDAAYFYYLWSLAHALRLLGVRALARPGGDHDWSRAVEQALLERQRGDGSWSNRFSFMKEDDPLVATPLALGALGCALLVRTAQEIT